MLVHLSILRRPQDRPRQNQGDAEAPPHACMLPGGEPPFTYSYLRLYIFYYVRHCCGPSERRGHPQSLPGPSAASVNLLSLPPLPSLSRSYGNTGQFSRHPLSLVRCRGFQQAGEPLGPFPRRERLRGAAASSAVLPLRHEMRLRTGS